MDKKRILLYTLAFAAFAVLVYMQFRTWRNFDWATFWKESGNLGRPPHIFHLFHAVALIYVAYFMRALRWKIFLRPVRPQASDLEAGGSDADRFHRSGPAGTSWGAHPPLSDCAAGEADVFFAAGSLGGGAHLRHRGVHHPAGAGGIFCHRTEKTGLSPQLSGSRPYLPRSVGGLDHRGARGEPKRRSTGELGRTPVCSPGFQPGSPDRVANSRISRRTGHHPQHMVVRDADGSFRSPCGQRSRSRTRK